MMEQMRRQQEQTRLLEQQLPARHDEHKEQMRQQKEQQTRLLQEQHAETQKRHDEHKEQIQQLQAALAESRRPSSQRLMRADALPPIRTPRGPLQAPP